MEYRIEKKDKLTFFGKVLRGINQSEGHKITEFIDECYSTDVMDKMFDLSNSHEDYAIYFENDIKHKTFAYMIAVQKPDSLIVPEDFEEVIVPESTWAVFTAYGPISQSLSSLRQHIFRDWLPASNYVHANAPMIEAFPAQLVPNNSPDFRCEIWIPIVES